MKRKILSFVSVLLTAVLLLCSCSGDVGGTSAGEISDYDSVQFFPVDDDPSSTVNESTAEISDVQTESHETESREPAESYEHKDYSENVTTQSSGFVVSDKMYDFEGNNLVVLNVENKTSKNYYLYIYAQYLDEDGNVLKEETRKFEGFAAGWKNNFFFTPGIPFEKFTYKMETKEYTYKCYGSKFTTTYFWERKEDYNMSTGQAAYAKWENNGKSGDPPNWMDYMSDMLTLNLKHEYESDESIALKEKILFLSSKGEVLRATDTLRAKMDKGDYAGSDANIKGRDYVCSYENNSKLVKEFENGEIVVLISIELAVQNDGSFKLPSDYDNYYDK